MKNNYFTMLLLLSSVLGGAQQSVLNGVVTIHNSKFETKQTQYVSHASVEETFGRSHATTTRTDGRFELTLVGISLKDNVQLSVKKQGWEVVNHDALSVVAGQLGFIKIYMSPQGKIVENKIKYYNIGKTQSEKALSEKIKEKQAERKKLLKNQAQNQKAIGVVETEIKNLYDKYQTIDAHARDMAERFSRVNLDDASEEYQTAFRYFQRGLIDSALFVLEDANYAQKVEAILLEEIKLAELKLIIAWNDSVLHARRDSLVNAYWTQIAVLKSLRHYKKAQVSCDKILGFGLTDSVQILKTYQELAWLSLLNQDFDYGEIIVQKGLKFKADVALERYRAYFGALQGKNNSAISKIPKNNHHKVIIQQDIIQFQQMGMLQQHIEILQTFLKRL
ncbi:MAG: hypothetical protein RLZZ628_2488 [Bacteroidota bacterium]